jgi:DNA polymerase-3 subunit gamma/tau
MERVLYRKYRPKKMSDVIGQEHITKTLSKAIATNKLAHAYLFTGPRGVGKTSVARILAFEANHINYDEENVPLDIIEIDAASNRRIDEVRDLREKINIVPVNSRFKVYIIDEVHMLTKEAFNALLKTLEEPPGHVIFILATTEAYKLPQTIISRTQRFNFKPVSFDSVVKLLTTLAKKEKIEIEQAAIKMIARHGEGSLRDSISLLDQLRHQDNTVNEVDVQEALGIAPTNAINSIISYLETGNTLELISILDILTKQGLQPAKLAEQLLYKVKELIAQGNSAFDMSELLSLMKELLTVQPSTNPEIMLKIVLLEAVKNVSKNNLTNYEAEVILEPTSDVDSATPLKPTVNLAVKDHNNKSLATNEDWLEILKIVKNKHNALYSVLRLATPLFLEGSIELTFPFKFHIQRMNETKNKDILAETILQYTGSYIDVVNILKSPSSDDKSSPPPSENKTEINDLKSINNIFGSSEVLES